jgi:hypothetical protein
MCKAKAPSLPVELDFVPARALLLRAKCHANFFLLLLLLLLLLQSYQRALSEAGGAITPQLEAAIEAMNTHNAWQVREQHKFKHCEVLMLQSCTGLQLEMLQLQLLCLVCIVVPEAQCVGVMQASITECCMLLLRALVVF